MPEGLPKTLGPDKLSDLLTFLLTEPPHMPRTTRARPPPPRTAGRGAGRSRRRARPAGEDPADPRRAGRRPKGPRPGRARLPGVAEGMEGTARRGRRRRRREPRGTGRRPTTFKTADVLVFYQQGTWTPDRARDIDAFLARGGGLVYLHYAVDGGADAPGFAPADRPGLAGRQVEVPPRPARPRLRDRRPPPDRPQLRQGALHDESYWQLVGDRRRVERWRRGVEDGQPQPLFWTLEPEKGRVFVSILGHYSWTFDDPLFRVLLLRGIAWTAPRAGGPVQRPRLAGSAGARLTTGVL